MINRKEYSHKRGDNRLYFVPMQLIIRENNINTAPMKGVGETINATTLVPANVSLLYTHGERHLLNDIRRLIKWTGG